MVPIYWFGSLILIIRYPTLTVIRKSNRKIKLNKKMFMKQFVTKFSAIQHLTRVFGFRALAYLNTINNSSLLICFWVDYYISIFPPDKGEKRHRRRLGIRPTLQHEIPSERTHYGHGAQTSVAQKDGSRDTRSLLFLCYAGAICTNVLSNIYATFYFRFACILHYKIFPT